MAELGGEPVLVGIDSGSVASDSGEVDTTEDQLSPNFGQAIPNTGRWWWYVFVCPVALSAATNRTEFCLVKLGLLQNTELL